MRAMFAITSAKSVTCRYTNKKHTQTRTQVITATVSLNTTQHINKKPIDTHANVRTRNKNIKYILFLYGGYIYNIMTRQEIITASRQFYEHLLKSGGSITIKFEAEFCLTFWFFTQCVQYIHTLSVLIVKSL